MTGLGTENTRARPAATLVCAQVLHCNGKACTGAVHLSPFPGSLVSAHVSRMSGLQWFTLTRCTRVMRDSHDTIDTGKVTHVVTTGVPRVVGLQLPPSLTGASCLVHLTCLPIIWLAASCCLRGDVPRPLRTFHCCPSALSKALVEDPPQLSRVHCVPAPHGTRLFAGSP